MPLTRLIAGILLFLVGLGLVATSGPVFGPLAFVGVVLPSVWIAASATGALVRSVGRDAAKGSNGSTFHSHVHVPRDVLQLLASIADTRGDANSAERDLVRRFVIERFDDADVIRDLQNWNVEVVRGVEIESVARRLALALTFADRDILFVWCCLITLADEKFSSAERTTLHHVARGLNLERVQARRLFHKARHELLGNRRHSEHRLHNERAQAFEILGLPEDAEQSAIRKRHRELVKQFHPDAQASLPPTQRNHSAERFRQIQRAYEVLRGT